MLHCEKKALSKGQRSTLDYLINVNGKVTVCRSCRFKLGYAVILIDCTLSKNACGVRDDGSVSMRNVGGQSQCVR